MGLLEYEGVVPDFLTALAISSKDLEKLSSSKLNELITLSTGGEADPDIVDTIQISSR